MKPNSIYIDLKNGEQIKWWNTIGRRLVKVVRYSTVVETATSKPVGVVIMLKGLFSDYVIKKNNSFIEDLIDEPIELKDGG